MQWRRNSDDDLATDLWWTCNLDPLVRSRALEAVARKHAFERVAADFAKQSKALAEG